MCLKGGMKVKAEEARKLWEEEVTLKAQGFLAFIKKKILQYAYQEHVFFYLFEFPDFVKNIQSDDEEEFTEEFIQAIFAKITSYFEDLGFKTKADNKKYKIWITYSKGRTLAKNSFTENLLKIIDARKNYRAFTEIDDIIVSIKLQIREKARRSRSLRYPLTLNIPNEKCLLLEDLLDIIEKLEEEGYEVSLEGGLANPNARGNKDYILKAIDAGKCFEKLDIDLIISW